jgi:hypothetical protein
MLVPEPVVPVLSQRLPKQPEAPVTVLATVCKWFTTPSRCMIPKALFRRKYKATPPNSVFTGVTTYYQIHASRRPATTRSSKITASRPKPAIEVTGATPSVTVD